MPLFGRHKDIRVTDSATFPTDAREILAKYLAQWDKELSTLRRLKVPAPIKEREFLSTYSESAEGVYSWEPRSTRRVASLNMPHPVYQLPPHLVFEAKTKNRMFGFVSGDATTIEQAKQLLEKKDLIPLVRDFQFRWFNRDPYAVFRKQPENSIYIRKVIGSSFPEPPPIAPKTPALEAVTGPSVSELEEMQRRLSTLRAFGHNCFPQLTLADVLTPDSYLKDRIYVSVSDDLLLTLKLPEFTLDEHSISFKILPDCDTRPALSEQFIESLRQMQQPLCFSLVSDGSTVYFRISCSPADRRLIEKQIEIHFPQFVILEQPPAALPETVHTLDACPLYAYQYLKTRNEFGLDPYSQFFAIADELGPADTLSVDFYFVPFPLASFKTVTNELAKYGIDHDRSEPARRVKQLDKKSPPWYLRLALTSSQPAAVEKLQHSFLEQYGTSEQRWLTSSVHTTPEPRPSRNIVNTAELVALVHFPDKSVECDRLETASMKSKLPPALYTQSGIQIGVSEARGKSVPVNLPEAIRDRHVYIVGKSGTGKSTVLLNSAIQDIEAGRGVAVIDPHGDLVETLLDYIPEHRINDTIYFNAADREHPIALNILDAKDDAEIDLLAEDLVITFQRTSESWGDKMHAILLNTFHTLLRTPDSTFTDITPLLTDQKFRARIIAQVGHPRLRSYWQHEFGGSAREAQPILTRMHKFTLNSALYSILSSTDCRLNFNDLIRERKIFLANISKGLVGADTSSLLGSLLVSQIQLAVMRQAKLPQAARVPFCLYIDEFQNFISSAFETILSEARKYKLCLTLAHQYVSQLNDKTKNAILANVGTIIMFQSYPADAALLRPELGQYEPSDVTNLSAQSHEALCKPATQSKDTFRFTTLAPALRPAGFASAIVENSQNRYGSQIAQQSQEMRSTDQVSASYETATPGPEASTSPPLAAEERADYGHPTHFIDGLHVCMWATPPSLSVLLTLVKELTKKGKTFLCIFDANTRYVLPRDRAVYLKFLEQQPKRFCEIPGKKQADEFLLLRADTTQGTIITNDQFREYFDKYRWLESEPERRLIKGAVAGENLVIPDLDMDIPVKRDINQLSRDLGLYFAGGPAVRSPDFQRSSPESAADSGAPASSSPQRPKPVSPRRERPAEAALLGRGGQHHKRLQHFLKRIGESKGYLATIEKQVLGGAGSVDLALEKKERSIACEISVTSTLDYELANVQKCLSSGFGYVVLISEDQKFLSKASKLVTAAVSEEEIKRVRFLSPEGLIAFIDEVDAADLGSEETVRGYKVKVKHKPVSEADKEARKQAIGKTIVGSLKREKGPTSE